MTKTLKATMRDLEREVRKEKVRRMATDDLLEKVESRKREKDAAGSLAFLKWLSGKDCGTAAMTMKEQSSSKS